MQDEPTCGKGLAQHSAIPRKMGALTAAVAMVLETHMEALDLTDERSKEEHAAYSALVQEHRRNAAALTATADRMAGCRELPMGRHDESAMSSPRAMQAFEAFVRAEHELLTLLQPMVEQDQAMLAGMREAPKYGPETETMTGDDAIRELSEAEERFNRAVVSNDAAKIASCISEDWVLVTPEAGIVPGERFLQAVESGVLSHDSMTKDIERVKVYGDIAVVTGRGRNTGMFRGQPISADEWVTDIYRKSGGGWICVLTHLTPVAKDQ